MAVNMSTRSPGAKSESMSNSAHRERSAGISTGEMRLRKSSLMIFSQRAATA